MIEKIYNSLVLFYKKVKLTFAIIFIALFILSFALTIISGDIPTILHWPWIIVGGSMIAFGFIVSFFHVLLGIKLGNEGKLDEAGNHKAVVCETKVESCGVCALDCCNGECCCAEYGPTEKPKKPKKVKKVKKKAVTKRKTTKKKKYPTKMPTKKKK